jgi:RNA polymerase primary sigma factor
LKAVNVPNTRPAERDERPTEPGETPGSLMQYFREISGAPLLSQQEEQELAAAIERGRMESLKGTRPDPQIMAEADRARKTLVQANLRFVVAIAKKYARPGLPLADVIQEGNIGLISAVDRFDYHRGYRLSTYAAWWIRQSASKAVQEMHSLHIPSDVRALIARIREARAKLTQALGRNPTYSELANETGLSTARIGGLERLADTPVSLESPLDDEHGRLIDLIPDPQTENLATDILEDHARGELRQLFHLLSRRDREVVALAYGFADGREWTQREIAARMGVSGERIRQMHGRALRQLRRPAYHGLRDHLD